MQFGLSREDNNGFNNSTDNRPIPDRTTTFVRVGLTVIFVGACLFVILSQAFPEDSNKWAFGIIGVVIGYWFR